MREVSRETPSENWGERAWKAAREGAEALGFTLPERLDEMLRCHLKEVERWDKTCGLIGNLSAEAAGINLALDALLPTLLFPGLADLCELLVDIGSGGGFPGLELACALSPHRVLLYESNRRKSWFLQHTCRRCGLKQVEVRTERWREAQLPKNLTTSTLLTTRAAIPPEILLQTARHLKCNALLYLGPNQRSCLDSLSKDSYEVREIILPVTERKRIYLLFRENPEY